MVLWLVACQVHPQKSRKLMDFEQKLCIFLFNLVCCLMFLGLWSLAGVARSSSNVRWPRD